MSEKTVEDASRNHPTADELRGLLGGPPADFVRERTALAARLKKEGRAGAAAAVKALRKPPLSAWATNRLSARAAEDVARLLDAGARLRRAQLALASGDDDRAAFTAASAEQRALVTSLTDRARAVLEDAGHPATPATLERVARNLRAGATSEEAEAAIRHGRLDADIEAQDFSALLASVAGAPGPARPAPARHAPAKAAASDEDRRRREHEEAEATRAAAARARAAEKAARADVTAAEKELARAEQRRGRAAADVETARASLREAEAELEAADTAVRRARGVLSEAEAILRRNPARIV